MKKIIIFILNKLRFVIDGLLYKWLGFLRKEKIIMEASDFTKMPYSSLAVVNSLLDVADENNSQIDPLKLQKLIYFAHGWNLAFYDIPLIDEQVQAWKYGPVINSVYHTFKDYGDKPIDGRAKTIDFSDMKIVTPRIPPTDTDRQNLLREVWRLYGKYTGIQLSTMSHMSDSPWSKAWDQNIEKLKFVSISNDIIKGYFKGLLNRQST